MRIVLILGVLVAFGCGGGNSEGLLPVQGTVTLDGDPISHSLVTFIPQDSTPGHGGSGTTNAAGLYEVTTRQSKKGLLPGTYKVTVSRRLNRDGTPPPPDEKPIESQAVETLPPRYSDPEKTEITFKLAPDSTKPFDLPLVRKKK